MKKENKAAESEPKPVALRERAEKIALEKALPENIDKISQAEVKRTIQELQVHQIELEMQNEELRLTQRELKASQARYLDLYDLAPVSYVTVSEKGLILEANLTAAALLGLPRSALVKQPLTRFIINEDQNIYYLHRKQLFETGAPQAFELRMVKMDETAFWAHLVATAAQDADGAPVCRVVLSDITEHKLAEEALIKSELKWRYILLNTPQIGISLDSDGKIIFVNDHFQKLTGWKAEEIIGQDWFDIFIPGKIREEIRNVFKAVMRQEDTAGHSTYENDIVIKNGELRLISWANVLTKDLQGKIIDVTCLGMDLTERVRNEEALRNSENKFRNISEYSLVGIYMIQDGIFSYVNSKFAEIFGYTVEECLNNMHFRQLVYPEDFDIVQEQVRKRATGEIQSVHYGFRGIKKTGELIHVEIFGSSIMLDGRPTVTGTMLDITMRKQTEEALQESEERFKLAMQASSDGLFDWNLETNDIYYSPGWKRILGYEDHELPNDFSVWENRTDAEDVKKSWELQQKLITKQIDRFVVEFKMKHKNGHFVDILSRAEAIFNESGKAIRFVGTHTDITERKIAEEHLEKFKQIVASTSEGISLLDKTYRYVIVNKAYETFSCKRKEELIGVTVAEYLGEAVFYEDIKPQFDKCLNGETIRYQNWFEYPTLGKRFVEVTYYPYIDARGEISGVVANTRDITERKRAEEALRESEELFRSYLENAPDGIFMNDMEGNFLYGNRKCEEIIGYRRDELIGKNFLELNLLPENSLNKAVQLLQANMDGKSTGPDEIELIIKEGRLTPVEINTTVVQRMGQRIVLSFVRDITYRKQAEGALRESESKLKATLDATPFPMAVVDSNDDKIIYWSRSAQTLFGHTAPTASEWYQIAYPDPEYRRKVIERWKPFLEIARESGHPVNTGEYRIACRDGSVCICELYATFLPDNLIVTFNDITMRKRAEQEKRNLEERLHNAEKMEVLGKLAGRVAHDLNNVLGVLSGYSELLTIRIPADNPLKEYAINIVQSSVKAAAIVEDLLTLTRRGVRVMEVAKVNKIIADLIATPEFDKLVAYHPSVIVRTDLAKDLLNISGSPVHLEKMVFNLVSNAVEAIAGGGKVIIKTENRYIDKAIEGSQTVAEGEYVALTVSDTGKGIPASELKKIYEPFYTKKSMGRSGTGLGLAIVQGAVQDHDGYIDVQSTEGKGTTFTLYFPATREKAAAELQKTPMDQYTGRGETVLVVDDVKEQREVATTLFTQLGYSVNAVSSGEDAVEYLKSNKADILVLDMIMEPGIDGLDTYKLVLEINPLQKAVIVSGFSETDRSREAQKLGAGPYVKKPYMIETIGIAIRDELGRK